MIRNICYANAREFVALPAKAVTGKARKPAGRAQRD